MNKRIAHLYYMYQFNDVAFNQRTIKSTGLVFDKILFKCGDIKQACVIYSSSMVNSRIIIRLTSGQMKSVRKHRTVSLVFRFRQPFKRSDVSFYIRCRITDTEQYSHDLPELYFCLLEYVNDAPDALIEILGTHMESYLNSHLRAMERFILTNKQKHCNTETRENILFVGGHGKRCVLTEISVFSAKVIMVGTVEQYNANAKAMLVIKSAGTRGVGEMVGNIESSEILDKKERLISVIITFNQELIPPAYKMWVANLLEELYLN